MAPKKAKGMDLEAMEAEIQKQAARTAMIMATMAPQLLAQHQQSQTHQSMQPADLPQKMEQPRSGQAAPRNSFNDAPKQRNVFPAQPLSIDCLPTRTYRVVLKEAAVRQKPNLRAAVCARKRQGDRIISEEETFDGWVKLIKDEGWMIRDMRGQHGVGIVLEALDEVAALAAPELSDCAGSQKFEVVLEPMVVVRREPRVDAAILGSHPAGDVVLAETQTYNGWVRLADGRGWMLSQSPQHGQLLHCLFLEEQAVRDHWPDQEFKVMRFDESVHEHPSANSTVLRVKREGDIVRAVEETFDGWVRLADEPGWIRRQSWGDECGDVFLEPANGPMSTVAAEVSELPGKQMFEVICEPFVTLWRRPCRHARMLGSRGFGDIVFGETQTYHGWVRLSNDEGWILGNSEEWGRTLKPLFAEEQAARRDREKSRAIVLAAEAAVDEEIEKARLSRWWEKLDQSDVRDDEIKPVGKLSLYADETPDEGNPDGLPVQEFVVVDADLSVRADASILACVLGRKRIGDLVRGIEETFDGWVKLELEPGWVLRDFRGQQGLGVVLQPVDAMGALAAAELADEPGRQMFEVLAMAGLPVYASLHPDAEMTSIKGFGEFVLAETQTYHGWIRLANNEGWAPSSTPEDGQMLLPVYVEEQAAKRRAAQASAAVQAAAPAPPHEEHECLHRDALQQLAAARLVGDGGAVRAAVERCKRLGVPKRDIGRVNAGLC